MHLRGQILVRMCDVLVYYSKKRVWSFFSVICNLATFQIWHVCEHNFTRHSRSSCFRMQMALTDEDYRKVFPKGKKAKDESKSSVKNEDEDDVIEVGEGGVDISP